MAGIDSNTKLMLNFNGADGATSTTDESDSAHTVNFRGTAQLDTAKSKWGTSSLLLDGDSDYLDIADSDDWDLFGSSTTDRTIDWWMWIAVADNSYIVNQWVNDTNYWQAYREADARAYLDVSDTLDFDTIGTTPLGTGAWHHVALCKVGSEYGQYFNGNQVTFDTTTTTGTFSGSLYIGRRGTAAGTFFNGWIDALRIQHSNPFGASPNVGNTDTITVPTSEYTREVGGNYADAEGAGPIAEYYGGF